MNARHLLFALGLFACAAHADPALNSHEVNADHSVTFRVYAPAAKAVTVALDYAVEGTPMKRGEDGVWTLTTGPLAPELHFYSLAIDGTPVVDPQNPHTASNLFYRSNAVTVPGATQLWDVTDVPHGAVHHHLYKTSAIAGLPSGMEDYYVYTPPGYDPRAARRYPVLYLLHGWSSLAQSWVDEGQANLILDNLIAQGRAQPMIIVMPLGYGDYAFVTGGFGVWEDGAKVAANKRRFEQALLTEIMPRVEHDYLTGTTAADRAIAGLSMGGQESLLIGLGHPERFGWVGGFSAALEQMLPGQALPAFDAKRAPRLIWVACGVGDGLLNFNRAFVAWLRAKGTSPVAVETPGIHQWPVWRANLVAFAPLLFRP
jgi:enterochelin esterase-like enzyme